MNSFEKIIMTLFKINEQIECTSIEFIPLKGIIIVKLATGKITILDTNGERIFNKEFDSIKECENTYVVGIDGHCKWLDFGAKTINDL